MRATKFALAPKRVYHVIPSPGDELRSRPAPEGTGTSQYFSRFILRITLLRKISIVSVALSLEFIRLSEADIQLLRFQLLWSPLATLFVERILRYGGCSDFPPFLKLEQSSRLTQGDHPVSQRQAGYVNERMLSRGKVW